MKRLYLLACTLLCMNVFAQELFRLEKTLEGQFTFNSALEVGTYTNLSVPEQTNVFHSNEIQGNSVVYKTYDIDYNLTEETYSFNVPAGYTIFSCTRIHMTGINDSDFFIVTLRGVYYGEKDYNKAIIYDKNGKGIFEFKSSNASLTVYPMLYKIKDEYKLIVWRCDIDNNNIEYFTDIYVLGIEVSGTRTARIESSIGISQIYNLRGELVGEASENQFKQMDLPRGIYILKGEANKKIIVE